MDIYNYLKNDHGKIRRLMQDVLEAESPGDRADLFEDVKQALTLHAEAEEETFYAALVREEITEEKIEEAEDDHDEMAEYMRKLSRISTQSEKWIEVFGEFKHAVEHHVRDEEGRIFDKARRVLSTKDAERLAVDIEKLKEEALQYAA